jgi:DNA ligase 1
MRSKSGRIFNVPAAWREFLPSTPLDGEIWAGRGFFNLTTDAVLHNRWDPRIGYFVFDAPEAEGGWTERIAHARDAIGPRNPAVATVPWTLIEGLDDLSTIVAKIRRAGGEGVMLYAPNADYRDGRTSNVLKLKRCPLTGRFAWRPSQRKRHCSARQAERGLDAERGEFTTAL